MERRTIEDLELRAMTGHLPKEQRRDLNRRIRALPSFKRHIDDWMEWLSGR